MKLDGLDLSPGSVTYYDLGSVSLPRFSWRYNGVNNSNYFMGLLVNELDEIS